MLNKILQFVKKTADKALLPQKAGALRGKVGSDIVTDADLAAERLVLGYLNKNFPKYGIYSEERGMKEGKSPYLWVLDPLDGTVNFASGLPYYSLSLGLLEKGKPILGVVYAPALKQVFFTEKGKGSYFNNKRIKVSATSSLDNAIVSIGLAPHFSREQFKQAAGLVGSFAPKTRGVRIFESGALVTCYVGAGWLDVHVGPKADPFGHTASTLVIQEAGGRVTDFSGRAWSMDSKNLICSNKRMHKAVLGML